jgi:CheY-like chemotaxis protein
MTFTPTKEHWLANALKEESW